MNTAPQPLTKKAGFVHRAAAGLLMDYLIPCVIFGSIFAFIMLRFGSLGQDFFRDFEPQDAYVIALMPIWWLGVSPLFVLINFILEVFKGVSIGKLIFRLRVCNNDGTAAKVSQRAIRALLKYSPLVIYGSGIAIILTSQLILGGPAPSDPHLAKSFLSEAPIAITIILGTLEVLSIVSLIFPLGFLMALGKSKRALHDRIAGTAVFSTKNIEI